MCSGPFVAFFSEDDRSESVISGLEKNFDPNQHVATEQ